MVRLNIHEYYMQMLPQVASRSTCARRAVAAIITNRANQILSTGYNGVPSGITHCIDHLCPGARDIAGNTNRCEAVHAEQNAIIQCSSLKDAYNLYCSCTPCFVCAKMILNTNIKVIYAAELYNDQLALEILHRGNRSIRVGPALIPLGKETT